jgi:hypothetical protein
MVSHSIARARDTPPAVTANFSCAYTGRAAQQEQAMANTMAITNRCLIMALVV